MFMGCVPLLNPLIVLTYNVEIFAASKLLSPFSCMPADVDKSCLTVAIV